MSSRYLESLTDLLIATLASGRNTRLFDKILHEREFKRYKKESVGVALSRLHKKGYVENSSSGWSITEKGKKYFKSNRLLSYIASPFEKNRIIRSWLRNQIKIFNYRMLQQSLWIGPGPLPLSFFKRLEDLNIRKNIKTFKISRKKN